MTLATVLSDHHELLKARSSKFGSGEHPAAWIARNNRPPLLVSHTTHVTISVETLQSTAGRALAS